MQRFHCSIYCVVVFGLIVTFAYPQRSEPLTADDVAEQENRHSFENTVDVSSVGRMKRYALDPSGMGIGRGRIAEGRKHGAIQDARQRLQNIESYYRRQGLSAAVASNLAIRQNQASFDRIVNHYNDMIREVAYQRARPMNYRQH